jgi:hypothetical protein
MPGTPGTPLPKKLGIKAGQKVCLLNAPGNLERHLQAEDVRITHDLRLPPVDVVVLFVDRLADLEKRFSTITSRLHPQGGFWVVFRTKRGSDMSDDMVRRVAMAAGMINDRTVEIDATFTGMRLVLRPEHQIAMMYRVTAPAPARRLRRPTSPALRAARAIARSSGGGSTLRRARARSAK